jgi:type IV pilus biogenesis protein CpaD/CtpE
MSLAHCTQTNNLVDMLVDPADLVAPPRLAPEDGQYLVNGVESWRNGRSAGSSRQDASTSGGSSTGIATPAMPATPSGQ